MSKENEGMPFVPEEDLNLHEDFQPIIAENGVIRPKKQPIPENLTASPDTTFTRVDTVQDLVQIRLAEQKSKEGAAPGQQEPESKPASTSFSKEENKTRQEQEPSVQAQTVAAESFAEVPTAQPKEDTAPIESDLIEELPPDLPITSLEQPTSRKRKSKKERRKLRTFFKRKESTKKKEVVSKKEAADKKEDTQLLTQRQPAALLPAPGSAAAAAAPAGSSAVAPASAATSPAAPAPKKRRRWPWVLLILCLLSLGTITGVVPVEKIPVLRNIAYAMGFSKDDTSRMSFLRALLTWTDKTIGLPGQWGDDAQSRLAALERSFRQGEGAVDGEDLGSLQARMQRESGKTSLIDINALNALQRQKGYQLDRIRGSVSPNTGTETAPEAVALRDDNVNVRTESNKGKGEVFFGDDVSSVNRNFQDGYDSVNAFKKIANSHIAGVNSSDWLITTAKSMMKADPGLGGINKAFSSMKLNWGADINNVGDTKPHRDLYYAWITSRMAGYTSNLMVKKALADTGFMGAEMPSTASNVVGLGGVQLDTASFQEDQEAWKEYLEFEKQCKEELGTSGQKAQDLVDEFNGLVKAKDNAEYWDFFKTCADDYDKPYEGTKFSNSVARIKRICDDLNSAYDKLRNKCKMVINTKDENCSDSKEKYQQYWGKGRDWCKAKFNEEFNNWWDTVKNTEPYKTNGPEWSKNYFETKEWKKDTYGGKYTQKEFVTELTRDGDFHKNQGDGVNITDMVDVVIDQNGGSSNYFPTVDTGGSVTNYMGENDTL